MVFINYAKSNYAHEYSQYEDEYKLDEKNDCLVKLKTKKDCQAVIDSFKDCSLDHMLEAYDLFGTDDEVSEVSTILEDPVDAFNRGCDEMLSIRNKYQFNDDVSDADIIKFLNAKVVELDSKINNSKTNLNNKEVIADEDAKKDELQEK